MQLANQAGAHVIALASHGHEDVMRLGASEIIDYRDTDAAEQVLAANDRRGLDAIVDAVSSASATRHLGMLTHAGGIACIAGLPDLHAISSFGISPSVSHHRFTRSPLVPLTVTAKSAIAVTSASCLLTCLAEWPTVISRYRYQRSSASKELMQHSPGYESVIHAARSWLSFSVFDAPIYSLGTSR